MLTVIYPILEIIICAVYCKDSQRFWASKEHAGGWICLFKVLLSF